MPAEHRTIAQVEDFSTISAESSVRVSVAPIPGTASYRIGFEANNGSKLLRLQDAARKHGFELVDLGFGLWTLR